MFSGDFRMKQTIPSKIDELLAKIDPSETIGVSRGQMDRALNQFSFKLGMVRDFSDYCKYLAEFYCQVETICISRRIPVNEKMDYFRCAQILTEEYGSKGEQFAYEMVKTGADGGQYTILNLIARKTVHKYSRNIVRSHVDSFIRSLSFNERLEAAAEYRRRFGSMLPCLYVNGSVAVLAANLEKILEEHPFAIQRLHRVLR
jgi:hypothetical protein